MTFSGFKIPWLKFKKLRCSVYVPQSSQVVGNTKRSIQGQSYKDSTVNKNDKSVNYSCQLLQEVANFDTKIFFHSVSIT